MSDLSTVNQGSVDHFLTHPLLTLDLLNPIPSYLSDSFSNPRLVFAAMDTSLPLKISPSLISHLVAK